MRVKNDIYYLKYLKNEDSLNAVNNLNNKVFSNNKIDIKICDGIIRGKCIYNFLPKWIKVENLPNTDCLKIFSLSVINKIEKYNDIYYVSYSKKKAVRDCLELDNTYIDDKMIKVSPYLEIDDPPGEEVLPETTEGKQKWVKISNYMFNKNSVYFFFTLIRITLKILMKLEL